MRLWEGDPRDRLTVMKTNLTACIVPPIRMNASVPTPALANGGAEDALQPSMLIAVDQDPGWCTRL